MSWQIIPFTLIRGFVHIVLNVLADSLQPADWKPHSWWWLNSWTQVDGKSYWINKDKKDAYAQTHTHTHTNTHTQQKVLWMALLQHLIKNHWENKSYFQVVAELGTLNKAMRNTTGTLLVSCFTSNIEYYKQDHYRNWSFRLKYSQKINNGLFFWENPRTDVVYSFASFSPICRFTEISWAKLGNN